MLCGVDAPGLELVARALTHRLPPSTRPDSHHPGAEIDEDAVIGDYGRDLWHPEFRPGDVVVFGNFTIHRSYLSAGMAKPRYSIEFRVLPSATVPERLSGVQGVVFRRTALVS